MHRKPLTSVPRSQPVSSRPVIVSLALVAIVVGVLIALNQLKPPSIELQSGILLQNPRPVAEFALVDHDGERFDNARLQGRWTVIFPGFTHCPDICPATLGTLSGIYSQLDESERSRLQTVFLSVDPDRDTPDNLKQYVTHFSGDFTGVTGDKSQLDKLTRSLAVAYQFVPLDDGNYTVDHTAALVLISPEGTIAGYIQPPLAPPAVAADLRRLLRSAS
jgi:protein SCO1/2